MISFENDRRTRAEQRLLGALLLDGNALIHCEGLQPRDFSHDLHGAIFAAMRSLIERDCSVNAVSVLAAMRLHRCEPRFNAFPYLLTLLRLGGVPAHAGYYVAIMLDRSQHHECDFTHREGLCGACRLLVRDVRNRGQ